MSSMFGIDRHQPPGNVPVGLVDTLFIWRLGNPAGRSASAYATFPDGPFCKISSPSLWRAVPEQPA